MRRSASGIWTDARFSLHLSVDVSVLALCSQMPPWLPAALGFVRIGRKAITPLLLVQKKKKKRKDISDWLVLNHVTSPGLITVSGRGSPVIGPPLLGSHFHSQGGRFLSHGYPWRRSSREGSIDAPYNWPPRPTPLAFPSRMWAITAVVLGKLFSAQLSRFASSLASLCPRTPASRP